jgi:urease accessory protein
MNLFRRIVPVLLVPALAAAHPIPGVGDFYSGMLHPLLSLDQIVPLIALSLLAGQQERRTAIAVLLALPLAVIAGATAALVWQPPASLALSNIAAMVVLGALVALSRPLPRGLLCSISIALGLALGLALGSEITLDEAPRFIPGASLESLAVAVYGIGLVRWLKAPWTRIAVRVAGSWVAAIGIMVLGLKQ